MHSRRADGRFRRATLENTFGLRVLICPECSQLNPYEAGTPAPDSCHACGAALQPRTKGRQE
jgi:rubrerythrin